MDMMSQALDMNRKALKLIEERLELNPDDARACQLGAVNATQLDDTTGAINYGKRALAIDPDDPLLLYNMACMHAMLGDADEALNCLESAVDKGYGQKDWVAQDCDLDSLRELPRFKSIVQAM
jgi:adenylate cyclase